MQKNKMDSDEFILLCVEMFLGHAIQDVFVVRQHGKKPALSKPIAQFSLTHTQGCLAVAVSTLPVGIDAERLDRACNFKAIARRFFAQEVVSAQQFFQLWTAKEAGAKCAGVPLMEVIFKNYAAEYFSFNGCIVAVVAEQQR